MFNTQQVKQLVLGFIRLIAIICLPSLCLTWQTAAQSAVSDKAQPAINILVSVKPIQLIAKAITGNITTPNVLVPVSASPHHYSLKPSDLTKIRQADVVFWIGPQMEVFLQKPLAKRSLNQPTVSLMDLEASVTGLAPVNHQQHHDHHHHSYASKLHIWLDPKQALRAAHTIANTLSDLYPNYRSQWQTNLTLFADQLRKTDLNNQQLLSTVNHKGFFVLHDAYGLLAEHYQLNIIDNVTTTPDQLSSTRHIIQLRKKLSSAGKTCLFLEPQFSPRIVTKLTQGLPIKKAVLDPLAIEQAVSQDGYINYLQTLAGNLHYCLSTTG
ncbi:zinc ABC transporter substrate-binding protein [Endozoicomonas sp. SM1973]|uniref:High-affinity zinc uptake system protein ZnuA n=1 Tax=Spartinivicinus marinus TaxID=2994442 RepID=A0A853I4P9_9GAMM|nr:zinc ABC transporter substrate-binding protein [Spartinivicinus marinus]MCX4026733.1 zinc ABC transporter substrate-binding protein [Spartinivicinus marinus]NYZ64567.1 zinc ABC transporter substrate-binding protein [Spartinivicinus marinus]